jgi:hypothetical protein
MASEEEILNQSLSRINTHRSLWWGHEPFKPTAPTAQQVDAVVNTPLTQFGPGPAVFGQQGSITNAAPASIREQTEQMLRPMTGTDFSRGMTGSQSGIGVADFVPGVGTPAAVADFMDVRNKVKTGEAGPLDYGLTGAGVALSAVPGGVAAKKILQKGVNYSSKLMDQVLDRAKNVTATPTDWAPTGRSIEIHPKDHPDDPNLIENIVNSPYSKEEIENNYAGFEEIGGFPSPFQYASEVKLGEVVGADPISKAQIKSEIVNKGDVIKQDRALMERALAALPGDKVHPKALAMMVDKEVVPLTQKLSKSYADYDTSNLAKEAGGTFETAIYQGPLYHGADNHFNDPYYFAHTRRQDLGDEIDRTLDEAQLRVERRGNGYYLVDENGAELSTRYNTEAIANGELDFIKNYAKGAREMQGVRRILEIQSDAMQKRHNIEAISKERSKLSDEQGPGTNDADRMLEYQNLWQYRVAREEIKQAAIDGKKEVWFPTAQTASRVENWDDVNNLHMNRATTEDDVADVFVEDPDNPFVGSPMVKNNIPMASDPEIHEKLSRKSNPYRNELKYLEEAKLDMIDRMQEVEKLLKHASAAKYDDLVDGYNKDIKAFKEDIARTEQDINKMKAMGDKSIPESKYYGLYNMYQDLSKWLKKEFKAEHVTDSEGLSWVKVKINPEQANEPVRAFKSVAPFLAGGGAAAAAATQRGEDERTN